MAKKGKFRSKRKVKKTSERVLVECSPHRITGGGQIDGLTSFDVEHESAPEGDTLALLSLCHDIKSIKSQSSREPYEFQGRTCHHIPDFTVECFTPELRIEVKALAWLITDSALDKYTAVARGYLARQIPFVFLVDAQLQEAPRVDAVRLLARYVTEPEFWAEFHTKQITIVNAFSSPDVLELPSESEKEQFTHISDLPEKFQEDAMRKVQYVKGLIKAGMPICWRRCSPTSIRRKPRKSRSRWRPSTFITATSAIPRRAKRHSATK